VTFSLAAPASCRLFRLQWHRHSCLCAFVMRYPSDLGIRTISHSMNANHFTEAAYSTQPASKASPNATRQAYHAARDSQADEPASKSARDDAPHAKTYKRTWSPRPARFAPNSHAKISSPADSAPPKEHPSTSANTAQRFSDAQPQPASSCTGQDQAAQDTSNAAPSS
jgi:hypothetical protein